jgi:hypothetical protein
MNQIIGFRDHRFKKKEHCIMKKETSVLMEKTAKRQEDREGIHRREI